MGEHVVKILKIEQVTHDVKRFKVEKPEGYKFTPGQATDVAVNQPGWEGKKRNFTFTALNEWPELEFTIKIYDEHEGVTKKIGDLKEGDELIIEEPWGAIHYEGEGVFIAGGAGITPFIAILRQLRKDKRLKGHTLIFSNKTEEDIIIHDELEEMRKEGLRCIFTTTRDRESMYSHRRVDENFIREKILNFHQHFYICGPLRMVGELNHILQRLGADVEKIIVET